MKAQSKVTVVTGGGSDIGCELTLNLLCKGAKVAIIDVNEKALQEKTKLARLNGESLSIL